MLSVFTAIASSSMYSIIALVWTGCERVFVALGILIFDHYQNDVDNVAIECSPCLRDWVVIGSGHVA